MKLSEIVNRYTGSDRSATAPNWEVASDPWGRSSPASRSQPAATPKPQPATAPQQQNAAGDNSARRSASSTVATAAQSAPTAPSLLLPPPLRRLPAAWGLEIQRIAHHLSFGLPHSPQVVLFAAPIPRSGVTTLTYLLSHHLASSAPEGRTLLLRYLPQAQPGVTSALAVGDPFSWQQLPANHALNVLTLWGGSEYSVAEKVRWFRALVASARRLFATILIDTPPFNRCAESYLLASESDGVVFVLKSGEARKPAVAALYKELQHMNINVLGGVLTFRRYPLPQWLIRLL